MYASGMIRDQDISCGHRSIETRGARAKNIVIRKCRRARELLRKFFGFENIVFLDFCPGKEMTTTTMTMFFGVREGQVRERRTNASAGGPRRGKLPLCGRARVRNYASGRLNTRPVASAIHETTHRPADCSSASASNPFPATSSGSSDSSPSSRS